MDEAVSKSSREFPDISGVQKYTNYLWNQPTSSMLNGISVEFMSQLLCDQTLSETTIEAVIHLLNKQATEDTYVLFHPCLKIDRTAQRKIDQVLSSSSNQIHFILNVHKKGKDVYVTDVNETGSHWSYFTLSTDLENAAYIDSLGWSIPCNLLSSITPILKAVAIKRDFKFKVPSRPKTLHSVSHGLIHVCDSSCNPVAPRQTCGVICGVFAVVMCVLSLNRPQWKLLIMGKATHEDLETFDIIKHPSKYSKYLRFCLMSWIGNGHVNLHNIVQKDSTLMNITDKVNEEPTTDLPYMKPDRTDKDDPTCMNSEVETKEVEQQIHESDLKTTKCEPDYVRCVPTFPSPNSIDKENPTSINSAVETTEVEQQIHEPDLKATNTKCEPDYVRYVPTFPSHSTDKENPKSINSAVEKTEVEQQIHEPDRNATNTKCEPDYVRCVPTFPSSNSIDKENPTSINSAVETTEVEQQIHGPDLKATNAKCEPDYLQYVPTFPLFDKTFFGKIGELAMKNVQREEMREKFPVRKNDNHDHLFVCRNKGIYGEHLNHQLQHLQKKMKQEPSVKHRAHLHGIFCAGNFILSNGPLVKTQDAGNVFTKEKKQYHSAKTSQDVISKKKMSINILETLSKHLYLMQVYIRGTAFLMENQNTDVQKFVDVLCQTENQEFLRNKAILDVSSDNLGDYIDILDTELDKQVVKGLLVKIFSINSVSKCDGFKNKQALRNARDQVPFKLQQMKDIEKQCQVVKSNMTNEQQHLYTKRKTARIKTELIRSRVKGAGRDLKSNEFQELAKVLEAAFGDGAQIHPRLTSETIYKSNNCALTMKDAREILLTAAPENFSLSLSTCYNYTNNYREGSRQAKQHHAGQGVNANVSLHSLPRVARTEDPINSHYASANINYILDEAAKEPSEFMIDCKDAKGIVCADIDPVQNMGKSWKKTDRADHQFEQSRINAVTPMTHLYMRTLETNRIIHNDGSTSLYLTRTGQAVTLINLSYYEPETVYRCFNEIFLLMASPALDSFFRSEKTGKLKSNFIFVVDNGASECPSNVSVQMLATRLVNFLQPHVNRASQISFCEYMSKQNPAERPHAEENRVLSRHGPFKRGEIWKHANVVPGSEEHKENMEIMAKEVIGCIGTAVFAGERFISFRGVRDDFVFQDEEEMKNFLKISEQKTDECLKIYRPVKNQIYETVIRAWDIDENFEGSYADDYKQLKNTLDDNRTAWLSKYCTTIYSKNKNKSIVRKELQPLPDFFRWITSQELHYMTLEERKMLPIGEWDLEGLFTPSVILELVHKIIPEPPESILQLISLLAWISNTNAKQEMDKLSRKKEQQLKNDTEKDRWRESELFKLTKQELENKCKENKVPFLGLKKIDLVNKLADTEKDCKPERPEFSGNLEDIPSDVKDLQSLSVGKLREVLNFFNIDSSGNKDELVLKTYLTRHGRSYLAIHKEIKSLKELIYTTHLMISEHRKLILKNDIPKVQRMRTYGNFDSLKDSFGPRKQASLPQSISKTKSVICVPNDTTFDNLHKIFKPLLEYLDIIVSTKKDMDTCTKLGNTKKPLDIYEQCCQVGARIKVNWTKEELGDIGWRLGWYNGDVQGYDEDEGTITVVYLQEPDVTYNIDLANYLARGKLRLVRPVF